MLQSNNPRYKEYVELKMARNFFGNSLGFRLTEIQAGYVEGELPIEERHEQQNGFVHGGLVGTLCDMACGFAAYTLVAEGIQVFTVEIKTSFLRPAVGEKLLAKGRVIKAGKGFHFCEAEIYAIQGGEEKMVAKASSTMAVVNKKMNDKYGD
ncbi:MAG: PaaI family thioesterase [Chitinophagales bacterium]|nr:PaaI family thioesterase [Chitinophagales bacterium]